MQVINLMAGVGSRMKDLTQDTHKSMLPINKEQLVLDYQMRGFEKANLTNISLVLGHLGDRIQEFIGKNYSHLNISYVFNDEYKTKNLDWSIYKGLSSIEGDVIYYEGDILADPMLLSALARDDSDICVLVDAKHKSSAVDTIVTVDENNVANIVFKEHNSISKIDHANANSVGELVCVIRMSDRARRYLVDKLEAQSFVGGMSFYKILTDAMNKFRFNYIDTHGLEWVEIDNAADLYRARAIADAGGFGR